MREQANQERAFSLSEEAITIADDCDSDNPTAVNKARLQVDARNTNDLHLNALKTLKE